MKIDHSNKFNKITNFFFYLWLLTLIVFFGAVFIENSINPGEPFSNETSEYILLGVVILGVIAFLAAIFFAVLTLLSKKLSRKSKPPKSVPKKATGTPQTSLYGKFEEELSDIIFVPQKSKYGTKHLLIGSIFVISVVVVVVGWPTGETPSPVQENPSRPVSHLQKLNIEDVDSKWINQMLYVTGVIRNNNSQPVFNIIVRVDFYSDKENKNLFDTRIFEIESMAPKSAFTFEKPVNISPKYNQWWFTLTITSAE